MQVVMSDIMVIAYVGLENDHSNKFCHLQCISEFNSKNCESWSTFADIVLKNECVLLF